MDLLAGYGSDTDSDHDELVKSNDKPTQPPSITTTTTTTFTSLSDLPAPSKATTTHTAPLFSGLPSSNKLPPTAKNKISKKKKKLIARFGVPIDYGDAVALPISDDDDSDGGGDNKTKKKIKKRNDDGDSDVYGTVAMMGMPSVLPAPITTNTDNDNNDDDDTAAIDDDNNDNTIITHEQQYIVGEYQGQQYLYDTYTGQYYYPDNIDTTTTTTTNTTNVDDNNDNNIQLPPGIQFKEISGAALRHMEPAARAEIDAVRSALGPDYEDRLRRDAAKVGSVSKLAKRKHQLSSLYVQSKDQELEELEKGSSKNKSRAATMKKYGW